ncbi:histidinol-phosphate aminotransferase family protein, partial [bacterium]|nr:histidinol-phosphate aminotransferase family protein [bacterium]
MTVGKKRRIIDLSSNETPFGPGPMVIKAIGSYASSVHRYPEIISFELGQSLARLHGLGPDNYIFGAGSNEVIDILLQALLAPKDKVLMSFPTFSQYKVLAEKQGAAIQEVPLEMDFSFNPDAFLSHAGNAKVIFLCNPNNPTGSSISRGDILRVLKEPACVVVDEAYAEFSRESVIDLVKKYENLVVLRTFSKAYGLAGLRVGYGVACRDLAEKILKVKNPFNVNSLAQKSALAALSDRDHLEMT